MGNGSDDLSRVFSEFYGAYISKEVSAKNSTVSVYDLQLSHAKAVASAAYEVFVEKGSKSAKTYLAHLEYVMRGMCQMDIRSTTKFENENGTDFFKRWIPVELERKNADSAREQILDTIENILGERQNQKKELEKTNLKNQSLERQLASMQREFDQLKDMLGDKDAKRFNKTSEPVIGTRETNTNSQRVQGDRAPSQSRTEEKQNRRRSHNDERYQSERRQNSERDQESSNFLRRDEKPKRQNNERRQSEKQRRPSESSSTRRSAPRDEIKTKMSRKREEKEVLEENVENFHEKVKNLSIKDDDREVLINGDKQDRKRRSRPMENSSPRKRDQDSPQRTVEDGNEESNSVWFPGDKRHDWERPCFAGYKTVVLGDSQLKVYGRNKLIVPGYNISSYSGCDILELMYILRCRTLKDQYTNENPFIPKSNRDKYRNGTNKKDMHLNTFCPRCRGNCMKKFTGRLILGIGLNNALKAFDMGFQKQDVKQLLISLMKDVNTLMPNLHSVHLIKPIKPPRWRREQDGPEHLEVYNKILSYLDSYRLSTADPSLTKKDFDEDEVHLTTLAAKRYWKTHFDAIESS